MRVLGIETTFDETSASVVEDGWLLLSNVVKSSIDLHAQYGGVVPEIAARSHIEFIMPVIEQALKIANCNWDDIDAIAVAHGAGLSGSLLVGVMAARTLAIAKKKPLYDINHVEGHLYANFITKTTLQDYSLPETQPEFPILGLIVSGAHSQLVLFEDHFLYTLLGQTQDDAVGEAFDKVGKLLGLPYPGAINVRRIGKEGNEQSFDFPKARMTGMSPALLELRQRNFEERHMTDVERLKWSRLSYDFSFSGIKTAVLRTAQHEIGEDFTFPSIGIAERLTDGQKADICASFMKAAFGTIVDKTILAYREFAPKTVIIGGGVSASFTLRGMLDSQLPEPIRATDLKLCTDNGAMIATLGCFKRMHSQPEADPYTLDIAPNLSM